MKNNNVEIVVGIVIVASIILLVIAILKVPADYFIH
jgi:hypothetical protein